MSPARRPFPLLLAVVALAFAAPAPADDSIIVGMSAAFTGPSRGLGIELYRGSMAWFDEVNEKGGVHGRKIVLKTYDDGYNPVPAIENTVKLIEQDHAFVLFDYVGTPTVTRVLPLLKRHENDKIFLFCPFTGAEPMRRPPYDQFVYNLRASYGDETAGLVKHFVEIGRKKIAVFYQIDAYGRSGWEGVREALAKQDPPLAIAAEATYRRGANFTDSMKPQVEILHAADPDAVICVGAYAACAAFIRDARDAGWGVPIANVSFVGSENLFSLLQKADADAHKGYTHDLINSQVVPNPYSDLPGVKLYREMMEKHHPDLPAIADQDYQPLPDSFVSLEGFLNARLLTEVLDQLGDDPKRDALPKAAESIKEFNLGIAAQAAFGPGKRQAMDHVYYTVASAQDGRFVRLKDEEWRERWGR
ncbi:MAG TPA: ABC transporter substrate-binding protein [Gemmataceae bacterium]|nr:ABC transporter substrate-binding protein [Gemmataceae bacterium]